MKKTILIIIALCTLSVFSQDKTEVQKDAELLVEIISKPSFEPLIDQFSVGITEEKKAEFKKEVEATFPALYTDIAKIYVEEFTHDEIKELLNFYETKIGKKLAGMTSVMSQKGMVIGQAWGMKVYEIQQKFM